MQFYDFAKLLLCLFLVFSISKPLTIAPAQILWLKPFNVVPQSSPLPVVKPVLTVINVNKPQPQHKLLLFQVACLGVF